MKIGNIQMKSEKLNKFADECPEELNRFEFDRIKAKDYTIKYIIEQEKRRYDDLCAKYPYFRFRGMHIEPGVAKDIICKSDLDYGEVSDGKFMSVENINLINNWANLTYHRVFNPYGWCHPDGTIGYNGITTKYPNCSELLNEVINIKLDFPFLKFMVAFSYWNSEPPYTHDMIKSIREAEINEEIADEKVEDWYAREIYPDFDDNIELLIYAHDKVFEIYWNDEACVVYKELLPGLQNKPDIKYVNQYYESIWFQEEDIDKRFEKEVPADEKELIENGLINYEDTSYKHFLINQEIIERYRMHNNIGRCFGILKRKPYFRVIGKTITAEQAKEFIKRTDEIIAELLYEWKYNEKYHDLYDIKQEDKYLQLNSIKISMYASNISIVRPDGIIDSEGISKIKYPRYNDFVNDMRKVAENFPFLDFIIAVTCWDECSPFEWNRDNYIEDIEVGRKTVEEVNKIREIENDIYRAIHTCIWVHDGKADWFYNNHNEGIEKFREYEKLYHTEDELYKQKNCFTKMGITKTDYYRSLLPYYGIPEELLDKLRYIIR